MKHSDKYIPALSYDLLTPLYDPLIRLFMRESKFKRRLIDQAEIGEGQSVLDLGCGTGTLTVIIKQAQPRAEVTGLDGDAKVLRIARAKAAKAGVPLQFDEGMSYQLPYADNSFDRVLSSMMLHHLSTDDKKRTLAEVLRVLRPGGEVHVVDFGPPRTPYTRLITFVLARMEQAAVNLKGLLPEMFRAAGFERVQETGQFMTIAGALVFYRARKP